MKIDDLKTNFSIMQELVELSTFRNMDKRVLVAHLKIWAEDTYKKLVAIEKELENDHP